MSDNWRQLKIGDRIRFHRMPPIFARPDNHVPAETLALYELLISSEHVVEIDDFLEDEIPTAGYVDRRNPENPVFHALLIHDEDEGCWEVVSNDASPRYMLVAVVLGLII
jgi:hypothetical protein